MALLAQPQPNVLAVAMTVGFDSLSGFTRAFRRHTGETPLAYRQRIFAASRREARLADHPEGPAIQAKGAQAGWVT
jgi:AraC-like DNA-binding protein